METKLDDLHCYVFKCNNQVKVAIKTKHSHIASCEEHENIWNEEFG